MKGLFFFIVGCFVTFLIIHPPVTFPYPNTTITGSFSYGMPNQAEPTARHIPDSLPRLDTTYNAMYEHDSNQLRKQMYDRALLALDSVHAISDDPRVDSIWKFLRPRLVYANYAFAQSLTTQRVNNDPAVQSPTRIFLLPLLSGEIPNKDSVFFSQGDILGSYAQKSATTYSGYAWQLINDSSTAILFQSITLMYSDSLSFMGMAQVLYHEGYHALLNQHVKQFANEDAEHVEIQSLTSSILESFMAHDALFAKMVNSLPVDTDAKGVVYVTNAGQVNNYYYGSADGFAAGNSESDIAFLKLYYRPFGSRQAKQEVLQQGYAKVFKQKGVSINASVITL